MTNVVQLQPAPGRWQCSACGASATAACDCGARLEYVSPGKLAADAIKANDRKSDRAIAAELGIGHATVSRQRATVSNETVGKANKSTADYSAPEKRQGRDGKLRRLPGRPKGSTRKPTPARKYDGCDAIDYPKAKQKQEQAVFNFRYLIGEAIQFADRARTEVQAVPFVPPKFLQHARDVAAAWSALANEIEQRQSGAPNGKTQNTAR